MPQPIPTYTPGQLVPYASPAVAACVPPSGLLHAYMCWAGHSTHAASEHLLGAGLPMLLFFAAHTGWSFAIPADDPLNFWSVLVGESGSGKSTAVHRMQRFTQQLLQWMATQRGGSCPSPFIMAEGSVPGILEELSSRYDADIGRSTGILYLEELEPLLRKNRDNSVGSILQMLSDGISDYQRNIREYQRMKRRGERPPSIIQNPHFQGIFCTTEAALEEVFDATLMSQGLFSRLWWFTAPWSVDRLRFEKTLQPELMEQAMGWARSWYTTVTVSREVTGSPRTLQLDTAAEERIEQFFARCKQLMNAGNRLNGTLLRAVEKAKLLACALAFSQAHSSATAADAECAVNIAKLCLNSAYDLNARLGVDDENRHAQQIFKPLIAAGERGLSKSELYEQTRLSRARLDPALRYLLDSERVVAIPCDREGPGRRATRFYARHLLDSQRLLRLGSDQVLHLVPKTSTSRTHPR